MWFTYDSIKSIDKNYRDDFCNLGSSAKTLTHKI